MAKELSKKYELFKELALNNEKFAIELEKFSYADSWQIIVIYYSALHYVNYFYCHKKQTHPPKSHNHLKIGLIEFNCPDLINIYSQIEKFSRHARYAHTGGPFDENHEIYLNMISANLEISKNNFVELKKIINKELQTT